MTLWYHEGARKHNTSAFTTLFVQYVFIVSSVNKVIINCFILRVKREPTADRVHSILTIINQSKTLDWPLQLVSAPRLGLSTDATEASDTNCEPTRRVS